MRGPSISSKGSGRSMTSPLRLLHVFSSSGRGGTERACLTAIERMAAAEFVHHVVFVDGRGPMVRAYHAATASVQALEGSPPSKLATLGRAAVDLRPAAVFAYGLAANLLWRAAWLLSP